MTMTMTLQEAIAEVKRTVVMDDPWSAEAVVLQAVASGELIPRTDADAEAARLRAALCLADEGCIFTGMYPDLAAQPYNVAREIARAALTTPEKDAP